jgi:hypothetical protein
MKPVLDEFKDNKYVHFEFCFPPKELIQEISKYDYGFWIDLNRQDNEHKFTTGNKFSTYLEAGLPFGYEKTFEFVDGLMKYYKLQFKIDVNDMDETIKELRSHNYVELEQNIIKAREHFNLNNNMDRLEKFIQKVAKKYMKIEINNRRLKK